jgi:hypothetical protein
MWRKIAVLIVSVAACHGGRDTMDTETADTDPPPALEGQIRLVSTVDGAVTCDIDVDFFSTGPYVGDCDGCDFAFAVDSTVIGDEPCDEGRWGDHMITYGLIETTDSPDRWLSFTAHYGREQAWGIRADWYNTLYMGGGPSASGRFAQHEVQSYNGDLVWERDWGMQGSVYSHGTGRASFIDSELTFAGNVIEYAYPRHYSHDVCPHDVTLTSTQLTPSDQTGLGDVACTTPNRNFVDVWAFDVDTPGHVDVSLDTTGDWFLPSLEIVDSTWCEVVNGFGSHACTEHVVREDAPYECGLYQCPAWSFDVGAGSTGTLYAIVKGTLCCGTVEQTRGTYRIGIAGAARPGSLRLAHDDAPDWTRYELEVTGSARLLGPAAQ